MKTITLKIDTETRDSLDAEADENGFDSRSAYLRDIIERRNETTAIREQYEVQIDELESELSTVREELESKTDTTDEQRRQIDRLEAERDRLQERVDELESELEHREARVEDLRRQLQAANSKDEKLDELAKYVERERAVEQRWREAGLGTRIKWRLFGMPADETSA